MSKFKWVGLKRSATESVCERENEKRRKRLEMWNDIAAAAEALGTGVCSCVQTRSEEETCQDTH